ncbi:MAG: polysaccharide deacetylase family protein [Gammaproteobacteria bacterium]|nr:polysaccharide deacetylase family protein [Gammaproteobacteria bacterium]
MTVFVILLVLFSAWFSFRYAWWAPVIPYRQPRVLMYHMVREHIPGAKFNGLRVTPRAFEQQLAWLKMNNWQFVKMSELMKNQGRLASRTVAITFDDGFADNYSDAFPLLRKYGAKATLYLVNQREGNDWSSKKRESHDSGELMREEKLSNSQVQEMLDSGVFELGAHTLTHANLDNLGQAEKVHEIQDSKAELEAVFKVPVTSFAYPFGIYSKEDCEIVRKSGYISAVTTNNGIDDDLQLHPLELRRLKISGRDNFYAFKLRLTRGRRGLNK